MRGRASSGKTASSREDDHPDRLDSWKEIASYLDRSERTVRRWERTEGLPVHRHFHKSKGSVYAAKAELDAWLRARSKNQPAQAASRRKYLLAAAFGLLSALLVAAGALLRQDAKVELSGAGYPVPLTSLPGAEFHPSFSPNGDEVAFAWSVEGEKEFDIYVKNVGGGQPRQLTTHPVSDVGPAWSPDGQFIAFLRVNGSRAQVILVPSHGGPERILTETRSPHRYMLGDPGPFLAWSQDGAYLVFPDQHPGSGGSALYVIGLRGGERRQLTFPPPLFRGDTEPALAPDGSRIAFVRAPDIAVSEIHMVRVSDDLTPLGEPKPITSLRRWTHSPAWTPNGREIVFSSGYWDMVALWKCPLLNCVLPERLSGAGEDGYHPAISKTGLLAYTRFVEDVDVWRVDLDAVGGADPEVSLLLASTRRDQDAYYSPDGQRIAFTSGRSGSMEAWLSDPDGTNLKQLTSFAGPPAGSVQWSPDGTQVVFDSPVEGQEEIFVASIEGTFKERVTRHPAGDIVPTWSRDGRWIYFTSRRSGDLEIWKKRVDGGNAVQVTGNGAYKLRESLDGKFLYYTRSDDPDTTLWKRSARGGPEELLIESVNARRWEVTEDGIYYQPGRYTDDNVWIVFYDFSTGQTHKVVPASGLRGTGIGVSPDGRSLLLSRRGDVVSEVMLVKAFD